MAAWHSRSKTDQWSPKRIPSNQRLFRRLLRAQGSAGLPEGYLGTQVGSLLPGPAESVGKPQLVLANEVSTVLPQQRARRLSNGFTARSAQVAPTVRFRETWRIGLAHIRAVLKSGFTIEAGVADADRETATAFRTALERPGQRYAVAVRVRCMRGRLGRRRRAV